MKSEKIWNVTFIEDYAVTTTHTEGLDETDAILKASAFMLEYYGRDFSSCHAEAQIG